MFKEKCILGRWPVCLFQHSRKYHVSYLSYPIANAGYLPLDLDSHPFNTRARTHTHTLSNPCGKHSTSNLLANAIFKKWP